MLLECWFRLAKECKSTCGGGLCPRNHGCADGGGKEEWGGGRGRCAEDAFADGHEFDVNRRRVSSSLSREKGRSVSRSAPAERIHIAVTSRDSESHNSRGCLLPVEALLFIRVYQALLLPKRQEIKNASIKYWISQIVVNGGKGNQREGSTISYCECPQNQVHHEVHHQRSEERK